MEKKHYIRDFYIKPPNISGPCVILLSCPWMIPTITQSPLHRELHNIISHFLAMMPSSSAAWEA